MWRRNQNSDRSWLWALWLIIALGGIICATWWFSPAMIEYLLKVKLEENSLRLSNVMITRPTGWVLRIQKLSIASENQILSVSGMTIEPVTGDGTSLAIVADRVEFSTTTDSNESAGVVTWAELVESIDQNLTSLPNIIQIKELRVCTEECLDLTVDWYRWQARLSVNVVLAEQVALISIGREQSKVELNGFGKQRFYLEGQIRHSVDDRIHFEAMSQVSAREPPVYEKTDPAIGYSIALTSLGVEVKGSLPLDGIVNRESIEAQFRGNLVVAAELDWEIDVASVRSQDQKKIGLKVDISSGEIVIELTGAISTVLNNPYFEETAVTIGKGVRCLTQYSFLKLDCTSPNIELSGVYEDFELVGVLAGMQMVMGEGWRISSSGTVNIARDSNPVATIEWDLQGDDQQVQAYSETVSLIGVRNIVLELQHNLTDQKGQLNFSFQQPADELIGVSQFFEISDLEIFAGEIDLKGVTSWDVSKEEIDFHSSIVMSDLDVGYQGYRLSDGHLDLDLNGWPGIQSVSSIFSLKQFDIGVPAENIEMRVDLMLEPLEQRYMIKGRYLKAALLGGEIMSRDFQYEATSGTGYVNLELEELALDQILALEQEDFESTGSISGSVPVQINKGKVSVTNGMASAVAPGGVIRYKPSESVLGFVAENDALKIVVDAMSDFQYYSLEAVLEYSPEGDLVAITGLKGSNPGYENGRDVHLNVRLEENLKTLLQSLLFSDEVADQIEKKTENGVQ